MKAVIVFTLTEVLEKPLDSIFIAASGQALTILASELQYSNVDPKKVIYINQAPKENIQKFVQANSEYI